MEPSFTERPSAVERAYIRWQAENNPGKVRAALCGVARLVRDMDPRLRELLKEEIRRDAKQAEATARKNQIEWSKPIGKAELQKMLAISRNTLKSRLVEGDSPACGKIRYQSPKGARKIQVAVCDLPADLQMRFRKNSKK